LTLARGDGMEKGFDEGDFFTGPDAVILKEQFKTHFRNVSRIMDCVGCDKCRLWGKLQVSGLGTALKILFELDEKALDPRINPDLLQRSEVVALFNTLHRISESLAAVEHFRQMYAETQIAEAEAAKLEASKAPAPKSRKSGKARKASAPPEAHSDNQISFMSIFGVVLSAFEAFRRSCRGCLDICWRSLESGWLGEVMHWLRGVVGSVGGKGEL